MRSPKVFDPRLSFLLGITQQQANQLLQGVIPRLSLRGLGYQMIGTYAPLVVAQSNKAKPRAKRSPSIYRLRVFPKVSVFMANKSTLLYEAGELLINLILSGISEDDVVEHRKRLSSGKHKFEFSTIMRLGS